MKHARPHRPWKAPEALDGWGFVLALVLLIVLVLAKAAMDRASREEGERRYQELQRTFERERAQADLTGTGRR